MNHDGHHRRVASDSTTAGYHARHQYSTFSASTIRRETLFDDYKNKFTKLCCCLCRLSASIILHPVGPFRSIWDMFVMLLLVYTSIEIPYIMSFGQSHLTLIIGICVDSFLFIDIIFNFHTAYFDKFDRLRLVTNKKSICKHYLKTWFLIDFITCIPFELIPAETKRFEFVKVLRVFRLFRIIKILRFVKMVRLFDSFMKQFVIREVLVFMRLFKIICGMLLSAHFAACVWWYVGMYTSPSWIDEKGLRDDDIDNFIKYSYSWYWAVVTLFTTGYGDIHATNVTEQWICSICILIGTCFYAYFIGTLTVLITEGDKIKSYQSDKLEEAQSFCEKKKLPKELTRAILTHIRYHCNYNYVFDEIELLNILPAYLQHDVHAHVAKQFLMQLEIFQNKFIQLPEFIIGLIAVKSKSISCNQWFKLYDIGDIAKEFYIQRTGVSTMYDEKNQMLCQLSRGSVCGEYSSVLFKKRKLKVECSSWSEFYSISVDDIKQILDLYYPKSSVSKWNQIKKYLRLAYKNNITHSVEINNYSEIIPETADMSAVQLQSPIRWEGSLHLFNNVASTIQTPVPVSSDNEDVDSDVPAVGRNQSLKREYSLPRNKFVYHSYATTSAIDNIAQTTDTKSKPPAKLKVTKSKGSRQLHKLVKYQIRSNSEVRDSVVVAHAAKHEKKGSDNPSLLKYSSSPQIMSVADEKEDIKSTEMAKLKVKINTNDSQLNLSDIYDSECSFSSSHSSESSFEDNYRKLSVRKHRNVRQTAKRKRRGIRGSFGKSYGTNVKKQQQIYQPKNNRKKSSDKKNVNNVSPIVEMSIDESVLLAPLQTTNKNNENDEQMDDDAPVKDDMSDNDNEDVSLFGGMPTIESEQELYKDMEVENKIKSGLKVAMVENETETVS